MTTVRVRCNNSLHSISIINSSVVLHDHDGLRSPPSARLSRSEASHAAACRYCTPGGTTSAHCRPRSPQRAARRLPCAALASHRRRSPSFRERCAQHVRELAESALRECRYRRAHSRWIDVVHSVSVTVADDEPPTLVGDTATTWHRRHAWRALSTTWRATVRPSWLRVHASAVDA
jgi:hypothetical protein